MEFFEIEIGNSILGYIDCGNYLLIDSKDKNVANKLTRKQAKAMAKQLHNGAAVRNGWRNWSVYGLHQ